MIFRNGEKWDGWKDSLKSMLGKDFALSKAAKFEVSSRYSAQRMISKINTRGKVVQPMAPTTTYASQVSIPLECNWVDESGESCIIRWAERSDKIQAGKDLMTVYTPENLPARGRNFKVEPEKLDLFWFLYCCSGHCGNGARFDENIVGKQKAELAKSTRVMRVLYNFVDEAKMAKEKAEANRLAMKALDTVRAMSQNKLLEAAIALEMPNAENEGPDAIFNFVYEVAKNNPSKINNELKLNEISIHSTVIKARERGVIKFLERTRAWKFTEAGEDDVICLVTKGENAVNFLVKWLREEDDNGEVLNAIKEKTKAVDNVTA